MLNATKNCLLYFTEMKTQSSSSSSKSNLYQTGVNDQKRMGRPRLPEAPPKKILTQIEPSTIIRHRVLLPSNPTSPTQLPLQKKKRLEYSTFLTAIKHPSRPQQSWKTSKRANLDPVSLTENPSGSLWEQLSKSQYWPVVNIKSCGTIAQHWSVELSFCWS